MSDLKKGGSSEQLYCWDERRRRLQAISTETLALGDLRPALEGRFEVETLSGTVSVEPAFERLKAHVAPYTPEAASVLCGTPAPVIRELARMLGEARAACNVESYALGKYHHGGAMMRSQILVFVLAGHLGRKGAGWSSAVSDVAPDALGDSFGKRRSRKATARLNRRQWYELLRDNFEKVPVARNVARGLAEGWVDAKVTANATLFWNVHGGVSTVSNQPWDTALPRAPDEYLSEALSRGWQGLEPPREHTPRVFFQVGGNVLRRVRASHKLREVLWPKLELVVVTDMRMSTTAREADYFLPLAGFYEKPNVGFYSGSMLNAYAATQVVPALGDSKDEWEIYWLLASEIEKRARARGLTTFQDRHGEPRRFGDFLGTYTLGGKLGRKDVEKLCKRFIEDSTNLGGVSWEEISQRSYAPVTSLGKGINDSATDWTGDATVTPYLWHTRDKQPWPTLSARVQFYIDHPWYLELGEELPAFKEPPKAGGDYPLMLNSGHARWSIHSLHQTDPLMLRLQRGEPCLYMSVEDARSRGIADWDRVEVFNDVGRFRVRVKISPAMRPGMLMLYHAWEDYQHEGGVGHRVVMASPVNPVELAGGQPYMSATAAMHQPGMSDRDTRVEVQRLS
ncbi:MAG: molybdopterin-dependent oxidoreductase [Gammaproteobacteria bacterium]|nr:molybdopterin-dependent oxidoreductase [Gammaproteobacteria bacterium]